MKQFLTKHWVLVMSFGLMCFYFLYKDNHPDDALHQEYRIEHECTDDYSVCLK